MWGVRARRFELRGGPRCEFCSESFSMILLASTRRSERFAVHVDRISDGRCTVFSSEVLNNILHKQYGIDNMQKEQRRCHTIRSITMYKFICVYRKQISTDVQRHICIYIYFSCSTCCTTVTVPSLGDERSEGHN